MADDLVEVHGRCGRRFAALVAGVGPGQWHDGTPCSQWDVRTLVHHLLSQQRWVPPMFEGLTIEQAGDRLGGDLMGGDASAWPGLRASAMAEAHAAVAQPGALERTVHLSFGDASGREYVMQLTADLAIHAWDLARATGQDAALLLPSSRPNHQREERRWTTTQRGPGSGNSRRRSTPPTWRCSTPSTTTT
jgi:uncharacterized protein (TIGR03086 family)